MASRQTLSKLICAEQIRAAERELASFLGAVLRLYGSDHAVISTREWLDELDSIDASARLNVRTWRAITIEASARLARRLSAGHVPANTANATDTKVSSTPSSNTATLKLVI
jgi:hypothetical protein